MTPRILGLIVERDVRLSDDFAADIKARYNPTIVLSGGGEHTRNAEADFEALGVPVVLFQLWSEIDPSVEFHQTLFLFRSRQIVSQAGFTLFVVHDLATQHDAEVAGPLAYARKIGATYGIEEVDQQGL